MKIRRATIEDIKSLQDLGYKLFKHDESWIPGLIMNWCYEDSGVEFFNKRLTREGICFVVEDSGKLFGYIIGSMKEPASYRDVKLAELESMFVEEEYRQQNIGKKLFKEFKDWSNQKGAQRITVSASAPNDFAIEFYKSVGFEPYSIELEMDITNG